jgi:hypothetical protein
MADLLAFALIGALARANIAACDNPAPARRSPVRYAAQVDSR